MAELTVSDRRAERLARGLSGEELKRESWTGRVECRAAPGAPACGEHGPDCQFHLFRTLEKANCGVVRLESRELLE